MYKPITPLLHLFLLLVLIGTGTNIVYTIKTATSSSASLPASLPNPAQQVEFAPEAGWSMLQPGLEKKVESVTNAQNQPVETVHVWRLDQNHFRLDVAFSRTPKSLENWQAETNAAMVVNGGYFSIMSEMYSADGLLIVGGQASGRSFTSGGMLAIDERGAEVRWLSQKPYQPGESLRAALQAFPILVEPGGRLGFGAERENYANARRTVIAQDTQGRILFIVTPQGYFTLHQLSRYLTESALNLDIALNLDGGGSTGLLVADPREEIPSRVLLPFVILVYEK